MAEHPFHLVVAALDDGQARSPGRQQLQVGGLGGEVFEGEVQAAGKGFGVLGRNQLLGFDVVDLRQLGLWLGQAA
ncbi:hypothetical protein D3C81_2118990 [compost metagenome]